VVAASAVRPQRPDVIDESFEGEAVLVHLRTGCYYALNATASAIWALLEDGREAPAVAEALSLELQVVRDFVAQLQVEELVEACAPAPEGVAGLVAAPLDPALPGPELQRFTDMQDLLMLDPIHDIDLDGDGWPIAPASGS
jgi:hypothetical protein